MNYERRESISIPEDILNVSSHADTPAGKMLSNFAETPFELDGKLYANVEAFWQGLYFPEGGAERDNIATLDGRTAKKAGLTRPEGLKEITYQEKQIVIGSEAHHTLMRKAIEAKFEQNHDAADLLLSTGEKKLVHILISKDGKPEPDSETIPAVIFTQILMDTRSTIRRTKESRSVKTSPSKIVFTK